MMHQPHALPLSRWVRFVALSLLLGFGLMGSMLLASNKAHAATTLTVSNCSNDSQLQSDVNQANSDNDGDTITFSCSGDIKLTNTLNISGNMTIDGMGQSITLDGQNQREVLDASSSDLTINALTIANGSVPGDGGTGGGINNTGTLTITNSTLSGNSVPGEYRSSGGGINNTGTATITNSTITNNSANSNGGNGGGINNTGTMAITNSTIANNLAWAGGGIANGGTMAITNSTIALNSSGWAGGGIYNYGGTNITNSTIANNWAVGSGAGIYISIGTVSSEGSIVAENFGLDDCQNFGSIQDNGYNLDSDSSCFTAPTSLHTNPQLASLANNGGPTQTMALQQDSPAIDTIPAANCPATDQRGNPRPDGTGETTCDMGAYESNYPPPPDDDLGLTNMPANITTNATSPQGAVVTYTPPTVVDEDSPLPPVNCLPASGSTFAIGTTTVTCTVSDSDDSNSPVSQSFTVTVNDTDLALTNMPANITVNATSQNGAVVTYTPPTVVDEDNPLPPVNCSPASGSTFAIGSTTVTCTVTDSDDLNSPVSQGFTVTVNPVLSVNVNNVTATEGSAFNGVVATGTAYGSSNPLSATINWGDGNSSTVSVTPNPDGSYSVSGSHTYAEEGSYALSVSVKDSGSLSASGNGSATVSDAALTLTHFVAGSARHLYAGLGATFTDADPNGQVSDYTATINWGDGNTSTVQVYKNPLGKGFVLAGLHHYASKGTYSVTLTVTDSGGSQVSKTVSITVK